MGTHRALQQLRRQRNGSIRQHELCGYDTRPGLRPAETAFISDGWTGIGTPTAPGAQNFTIAFGCEGAKMHVSGTGGNFIFLDGHAKFIKGNIFNYHRYGPNGSRYMTVPELRQIIRQSNCSHRTGLASISEARPVLFRPGVYNSCNERSLTVLVFGPRFCPRHPVAPPRARGRLPAPQPHADRGRRGAGRPAARRQPGELALHGTLDDRRRRLRDVRGRGRQAGRNAGGDHRSGGRGTGGGLLAGLAGQLHHAGRHPADRRVGLQLGARAVGLPAVR